jgi:BirA family biotin operon repressor/biotin-[acetyl-CoA-carboxylase] ligase
LSSWPWLSWTPPPPPLRRLWERTEIDLNLPPILTFEALDSTSAEARRRAGEGQTGPLWIMARRQTAGRGRRGRVWQSGGENLAATLLLMLDKTPLQAAQLGFVAALAVDDMAQAYVPAETVRLKWPNDVMVQGRKAAGILIDSGPAPSGGLWVSIGIGVNLTSSPTDVESPAIALADALRTDVTAAPGQDEAMDRLAACFAARLDQWLTQGFEPVRHAWLERAMGLGQACRARLPGQTLDGVAESLDADGALLLRLPGGEVTRVAAGDVFFGAI